MTSLTNVHTKHVLFCCSENWSQRYKLR